MPGSLLKVIRTVTVANTPSHYTSCGPLVEYAYPKPLLPTRRPKHPIDYTSTTTTCTPISSYHAYVRFVLLFFLATSFASFELSPIATWVHSAPSSTEISVDYSTVFFTVSMVNLKLVL